MDESASILRNKPLPSGAEERIRKIACNDGPVRFVIVGDLDLYGKYAATALIFTDSTVTYFPGEGQEEQHYRFSELSDIQAKRMYSNATMSAVLPSGRRIIFFRYTYAVAALCDAAALFIEHINEGHDLNEELAVMAVTFERALSVCPKCGRTLLHPGAECIMCRSKTKIIEKLWVYVKPQIKLIIFCCFLALITTAMALVPPRITGYIVDHVLDDPVNGLKNLKYCILLLLGSYVVQYGIGAVRAYYMRCAGDKAVAALRNDIYRKAQYLPMRFYDKTSTGSVINRIAGDSSTLRQFMLRITQEVVVNFFHLVGIVTIMLVLNPKLTLLSLLPIPLIVFTTRIFSKRIKPYYRRIWRRWSSVFGVLADSIPCVKVIKAFTGEKRAVERFNERNQDWLKMDLRLGKLATAFPQMVSLLVSLGTLVIWSLGGKAVITGNGEITIGMLVSFVSYAAMFYNPVTFFANLSDSFQDALASTEKILDVLEAEPESNAASCVKPDRLKGKIEFLHVSFSFDRTKKVLDDVSFTIEPGEVVGIVGTTGSGKSTLINLLLRFYDGYTGEILVDGHNIKNYDLSAYRSQIGYVQQDPMMFSDTIFNNISYSKPGATVEDVIHAADVANAHGFIAKQPDAYDTVLGERGVGVSGGEKQRISIARAVLMNPTMLVFDEATAAVDSETESLIQQAIDRLICGHTTLMIAHRLSTLKKANRIIVVDNGKIIENGTPQELLAKKGKYYKLIQIQSMTAEAEQMKEEENF